MTTLIKNKYYKNNKCELKSPILEPGEYVILKDEEDEFEQSVFKITKLLENEHIETVKLKTVGENIEEEIVILSIDEIRTVKINKLNLFKNYVINTSLIDFDLETSHEGEIICAIKVFKLLEQVNALEEFTQCIEKVIPNFFNINVDTSEFVLSGYNRNYNEDDICWFLSTTHDYATKVKELIKSTELDLLDFLLRETIYRFTPYNLYEECSEYYLKEASKVKFLKEAELDNEIILFASKDIIEALETYVISKGDNYNENEADKYFDYYHKVIADILRDINKTVFNNCEHLTLDWMKNELKKETYEAFSMINF